MPVSLNFSRLDFELMDATGLLEEYIKRYDIPKDYIHVEVTESALTENLTLLSEAIDRFHKDGFSLWLDDFGSGYSSLNVLKDFDFDVLKIDMKFLTNFEHNEKSRTILNTIIQLADSIGMLSLTEGVETEEEADFLEKAGCGTRVAAKTSAVHEAEGWCGRGDGMHTERAEILGAAGRTQRERGV